MEERENKVTGLRGVKLVMCNAHDQDTCHILNGEFGEPGLQPGLQPNFVLWTIYINDYEKL
jgi:hypothetical protein